VSHCFAATNSRVEVKSDSQLLLGIEIIFGKWILQHELDNCWCQRWSKIRPTRSEIRPARLKIRPARSEIRLTSDYLVSNPKLFATATFWLEIYLCLPKQINVNSEKGSLLRFRDIRASKKHSFDPFIHCSQKWILSIKREKANSPPSPERYFPNWCRNDSKMHVWKILISFGESSRKSVCGSDNPFSKAKVFLVLPVESFYVMKKVLLSPNFRQKVFFSPKNDTCWCLLMFLCVDVLID
jgi:hypothetical protein